MFHFALRKFETHEQLSFCVSIFNDPDFRAKLRGSEPFQVHSEVFFVNTHGWWAMRDRTADLPACKAGALPAELAPSCSQNLLPLIRFRKARRGESEAY